MRERKREGGSRNDYARKSHSRVLGTSFEGILSAFVKASILRLLHPLILVFFFALVRHPSHLAAFFLASVFYLILIIRFFYFRAASRTYSCPALRTIDFGSSNGKTSIEGSSVLSSYTAYSFCSDFIGLKSKFSLEARS